MRNARKWHDLFWSALRIPAVISALISCYQFFKKITINELLKFLLFSIILICTIGILFNFRGVFSLLLIVPYVAQKFQIWGINYYLAYAFALPFVALILKSLVLILSRKLQAKRNGYALALVLWMLWCLTAFYIHHDYNFDPQSGEALNCVAATPSGYDIQPCNRKFHPIYHTPVFRQDSAMAMTREIKLQGMPSLNRLEVKCEQAYFSPDGTPLAWYYRNPAGKIELFERPGKHPQFNEDLLPVSKEIVLEICQREATAKEAALLENQTKNELATLRQNLSELAAQNQQLTTDLETIKAKDQPAVEVTSPKPIVRRKAHPHKRQSVYTPPANSSWDSTTPSHGGLGSGTSNNPPNSPSNQGGMSGGCDGCSEIIIHPTGNSMHGGGEG